MTKSVVVYTYVSVITLVISPVAVEELVYDAAPVRLAEELEDRELDGTVIVATDVEVTIVVARLVVTAALDDTA